MSELDKLMYVLTNVQEGFKVRKEETGDSFSKCFEEYGLTMSCINIQQKLEELKYLTRNVDNRGIEEIEGVLNSIIICALNTILVLPERAEQIEAMEATN